MARLRPSRPRFRVLRRYAMGRQVVSRLRSSQALAAHFRASVAIKARAPAGGLRAPRPPPRRKSGADERRRAREIVDQLEALAAGRGVGDYPVADFVRAVAGARQRLGEERSEPRVLAVLEVLDAGVIELFVDPRSEERRVGKGCRTRW